jgi:Domain of unknown function (DUF4124)
MQFAVRFHLLVLIAAASFPAAGQSYKWVDENGIVNYGTKPPAGRPAQVMDLRSGNTIGTAETAKREAGEKRYAAPSAPAAVRTRVETPPPRGMDFVTYIRLQRGMSEGELLHRAGRPDHVSFDNTGDIVKSLYYHPTTADPFTTIVTVRSGRIHQIERMKKH